MKNLTTLNVPIAFKEMLIWEIPALKKFARNFMNDKDDAEDLLQDTMLKAMISFSSFKPGTNFKSWLYVIMRNLFVNFYRKQKFVRDRVQSEGDLFFGSEESCITNGHDPCERTEIRQAFDKLDRNYSAPLDMFIKGYKYHEIASGLKVPIGTIKTRIHVARKLLKKELFAYKSVCG